jgi:hypothetical protein
VRKLIVSLLAITASVFYTSCGDKDTDPPADIAGQLTLTLPTSGTIFLNGTTLQVRGNAIDNNGLEFVKVEIRNTTTGAILYQQNIATTNVTYYDFAFNWTVTGITSTTNATVKVIATDRYSYQVFKEVAVVLEN